MRREKLIISNRDIDVNLGMLVYGSPELYIGDYVEHYKQGVNNFTVYEISIDGNIATESFCSSLKEEYKYCKAGEILNYILCKESLSTLDAVNIIKNELGNVLISHAGLKDSSAHTCQFISIICKERLKLPLKFKLKVGEGTIILCFTKYGNVRIRRGYLKGNKFIIKLRLRKYEENIVNNLLENLKKSLVPN